MACCSSARNSSRTRRLAQQAMEVSTVLARSLEAFRPTFTPGCCCTNCGSNWGRTGKRTSKPRATQYRRHGHQSHSQPQQSCQPQPAASAQSELPAAAQPHPAPASAELPAAPSRTQPQPQQSCQPQPSRTQPQPQQSRRLQTPTCRLFGPHTLRWRGRSRLRVSQPRQLISRTIIRYALASRAGQNACAAPLGTDPYLAAPSSPRSVAAPT